MERSLPFGHALLRAVNHSTEKRKERLATSPAESRAVTVKIVLPEPLVLGVIVSNRFVPVPLMTAFVLRTNEVSEERTVSTKSSGRVKSSEMARATEAGVCPGVTVRSAMGEITGQPFVMLNNPS